MRGIPSLITDIRKKVFAEVTRMAYSGDFGQMEDIPYRIVPGESPLHRESVFLERAIAGERVRLAMGLSLQPVQTRTLLTEGMDHAAIAEQYYEQLLVNIIPYACQLFGIEQVFQPSATASQISVKAASQHPAKASAPRGQFPLQTARASLTNRSASDAASAPAPVRTTPSRSSSTRVRRRAAWTRSDWMKTARRGLIMTDASRAGSAL